MGLNEQQEQAVHHRGGPLLVLAGAGSGKTRIVIARTMELINSGVPPERILGVTFTNKAAGEMRDRVERETNSSVYITTFHSLGARILRESGQLLGLDQGFTIYDQEDSEKVVREVLKEHEQTEARQVKTLKNMISSAKNDIKGPGDCTEVLGKGHVVWHFPTVYAEYEKRLRHYNAVDFDDLLYLIVKLFREHPKVLESYQNRWWHLLVDEYQDTNAAQYLIVKLLVEKHQNLCVVGDPDQSIYSWRGADIHNILAFEQDFPGAAIVRLEQNYRSTQTILDAANALISHNTERYEKNLWSAQGEGEKIKIFNGMDERAESAYVGNEILDLRCSGVPLREMAIFYRTNAQSRHFEDLLLAEGIPYVVVGGVSFYQRREVKDVLAYLRMVHTSADFVSFARTINLPKRGLGATTIEKLRLAAVENQLPILDLCQRLLDDATLVKLNKRQKQGLMDYLGLIHELREMAETESVSQLVRTIMHRSGYLTLLDLDPETSEDRRENLDELVHTAQEWEISQAQPSLSLFLEELSLKANIDESDETRDRISLMTLHNSKGLEFDVAFLTGLEDDLLPHVNSRASHEKLEEERRLCYVGMTRARQRLFLTYVTRRYMRGEARYMRPSAFLHEIPAEYCDNSVEETVEEEGYYPDPAEASEEGFSKGAIVMHQKLGIGVVQKVYQSSQGLTYSVFFQNDNAVKDVVARYANLVAL